MTLQKPKLDPAKLKPTSGRDRMTIDHPVRIVRKAEAAAGGPAKRSLDDDELRLRGIAGSEARKFNPSEPRIPGGEHGGEWGGGGAVHALKDALKLGDKADLKPGEKLIGSDKVSADSGTIRMALVDHGGTKSLRLGIGGYGFGARDDEAGPWRAGPDRTTEINAESKKLRTEQDSIEQELNRLDKDPHADPARKAALQKRYDEIDEIGTGEVTPGGYTANLDQQAAAQLRTALATALDDATKKFDEVDAYFTKIEGLEAERNKLRSPIKWTPEEEARWDALTTQIEALQANPPDQSGGKHGDYFSVEGSVPGQWADVHYAVYLDDPSPEIGVQVKLGAVPHGQTFDDVNDAEQTALLDEGEAGYFLKLLGQYTGTPQATRAAGHDTTPGHDELHHYWVAGPGLAKWAESPKPWTTLVALLTPHVGPERAKVYASRWFIEHFGFAAGSDLNRVTHGKPPRGNKVGPG